MVKFWVLSDLHCDHKGIELARPEADAVLLAGDVQNDRFIRETEAFFVAGNHEFYGHDIRGRKEKLSEYPGFLDDTVRFFDGVRIIGATLWTDYDLYGEDFRLECMQIAGRSMNDHRKITWEKEPWKRFRPTEARSLHQNSRWFIEAALKLPHDGPTVVMTHHAPHRKSIHAKYKDDILNAAYVSDLEDLILQHEPDLWVHGHVHTSFDYQVGKTRVLCNPRGYGTENPDFNPSLIVEI